MEISQWYSDPYTLHHKDVDVHGSMRPSAYLEMFQETAWNHAQVLGFDYSSPGFENKHWVMARLRLDFLLPSPLWMEELQLKTAPIGVERLFARRDFAFVGPRGEIFAQGASLWLLIDAVQRKPLRPAKYVDLDTMPVGLPLFETSPEAIDPGAPDDGHHRALETLLCGYGEVDMHDHVNNVVYAERCFSHYPREFHQTHRLVTMELNFQSEALWGDSLVIYRDRRKTEDKLVDSFRYEKADQRTAALVRLSWEGEKP